MATRLTVLNDGPVLVKGEFKVQDPDGNTYELGPKDQVALCRCGHSAKKPFCDGSHNGAGFADKPAAFDLTARN